MTSALKIFLMLALLMQGAMASAMSGGMLSATMSAHAVQAEGAMPCHEEMAAAEESKMSCCDEGIQLCHAVCAVLAMPAVAAFAPMQPISPVVLAVAQPGALSAHRADLLRPPIQLSA